jgi:hypothetical protein
MAKIKKKASNLPQVSKQTAGGIAGAVIGGLVGGPIVAAASGIAGAMVGDSSAKGGKPIETAVKTIRSKLSGVSMPKMLHGKKTAKKKTSKVLKSPKRTAPTKKKSKSKKAAKTAKKSPVTKKAKKRAKK